MQSIPATHLFGDAADAALASKVQQILSENRRGFERVSIGIQEGTVLLSGPVHSFFLRQTAVSLAKRVAGVCQVVDDLEVDLDVPGARRGQMRQASCRPPRR